MSGQNKFEKLRDIVRESVASEWRRPLTDRELRTVTNLVRDGALADNLDTYDPYQGDEVFGGQTLLAFASSNGHAALVQALLDVGADPNVVAVSGNTSHAPLACADNAEIFRMLLGAGADPDGRDPTGRTALHLAASWGDEELVHALLERGADPLAGSDLGETPVQVLIHGRGYQRPAILQMLREAAAPRIAELERASVTLCRRKPMYVIGESFGAADLARQSLDVGHKWTVVGVATQGEVVSQQAASILDAPRIEQEAHKRPVPDARRFSPLVSLNRSRWTLVFADDLGLQGASALARQLSGELQTECILVFCELVKQYRDGFAIEDHDWSEEAIGEEFDPDEHQASYDGERERMQDEYNAWLAKHEVLIPPYELYSTGYVCGITLQGIRKGDLERADIIVLEEHRYDEPE